MNTKLAIKILSEVVEREITPSLRIAFNTVCDKLEMLEKIQFEQAMEQTNEDMK